MLRAKLSDFSVLIFGCFVSGCNEMLRYKGNKVCRGEAVLLS